MKNLPFTLSIFFVVLLSLACGTLEISMENPEESLAAPTNTLESTPTSTLKPFTYDELPAGSLVNPELAGMVFRNDQGVWVVDAAGQSRNIGDRRTTPVLSPNGEQVLYTSDEETVLWLRDLPSGESRILDDTPGQMKRDFSWWPERSGVIVYASVDQTDPWNGTLVSLDLNTGESFILDAQSPSDYALSPDGQTIALGTRENLRLYHWGGSTEYIVPQDFQLESWNLNAPDWSPDGTKLSLFGSRYNEAAVMTEIIIAVLDLEVKQSSIIYSYQAILGGEYPFYTHWSPDGRWISATTFGELGGRMPALWIISADGTEKHQFPYGSGPTWSPDGGQLVYWQGPEPDAENDSYLAYSLNHILVGDWQSQQLPVSPGSSPQAWVPSVP